MLKRLILIIAILGTGFRFSSAQETAVQPSNAHPTAEKPVLEFYPSQSIEIRGLLGQGESFTSYLLISSARNMQLTAKAKPLRDADKGTFLRSDLLSLSPNSISIEAGRDAELTFTVKDGAEPGTYTGELELLDEKSKNSWAVPVEVSLRHDASAKIFPEDEAPQVNTVSRSFLNFLLPESIRQEGINIRIDNEGDEELAISNVSLALKGQGTNAAFT